VLQNIQHYLKRNIILQVKSFGQDVPLKRAGQPAELAPIYVLLASQDSSYMTGSTVQVTGGTPII
jgi:NAD(P)-dependent dehydrogenase (short-subunit alcohol dehydrogenase family)